MTHKHVLPLASPRQGKGIRHITLFIEMPTGAPSSHPIPPALTHSDVSLWNLGYGGQGVRGYEGSRSCLACVCFSYALNCKEESPGKAPLSSLPALLLALLLAWLQQEGSDTCLKDIECSPPGAKDYAHTGQLTTSTLLGTVSLTINAIQASKQIDLNEL